MSGETMGRHDMTDIDHRHAAYKPGVGHADPANLPIGISDDTAFGGLPGLPGTRFRVEGARAQAAVAALGLIGVPACVIGTGRRLVEANDMFNAQLPRFGRDTSLGLRLMDARADAELSFGLTSLKEERAQGTSLVLHLKGPAARAVLHVIPLYGKMRDIFSGATAILTLIEPGIRAVPRADLIQELLDLTPAEARLARSLGAGATLAASASKAGISTATARAQLRNVFNKTGISRQGDLLAYIANVAHPSG